MAEAFERQLIEFLLSVPELSTVVDNRIYPLALDYGKPFPAATYQILHTVDEQVNHDGAGSLRWCRLQLDLWDYAYLTLVDLAGELDTALNGQTFTIGTGSDARTVSFFSQGSAENKDPKTGLFKRALDYRLEYQR